MIKSMAGGLVRLNTPMKPPAFPEGQPLLIEVADNRIMAAYLNAPVEAAEDHAKPTLWQRIKGWFV